MSQGLDELTEQIKTTSLSDEDLDWMRAAETSFAFRDNPDDAAYDEL